jgi:8-oxo-dGTP diphosphatase
VAEPPHYTVVCALIERDGRVLAAQRPAHKAQAGLWEFPGGKLEPGESPEAALVREIREELHLDLAVGARLPEVGHDYGPFSITLIPFRATVAADREPHPAEHAAVRWCTPAELRTLAWAPADVPVVAHYLAARTGADSSET